MRDIQTIANGCERFLTGHRKRSVRERVQAVADSPLSTMPNDRYGQGGFLAEFEREIAELLGHKEAVFMPSGTMAQPIALRIWSDRSDCRTVVFHPTCHLEAHEHHAYRELHGLRAVLLGKADRLFTLDDLRVVEEPVSTLLIELPQREIGGQLLSWDELVAICEEARSQGMRLHLDGARLWECAPFYDRSYAEIAGLFDSVYVSFYKILDGLPGAALAGPAEFVAEARIWQRRQGGNLQQQAASAISAKLGIERHLPQMGEYVAKAGEIAEVLQSFDGVRVVPELPPTNMMHVYFEGDPERLVKAALTIAEEERVGMFFGLPPDGKLEFVVGEATLELSRGEIHRLFERLFEHSGVA